MSLRPSLAPLLALALAACSSDALTGGSGSGGGSGGGTGGGGTVTLLPATVSAAMNSADLEGFTAGDATISIRMTAQDATNLTGTYARAAALDLDDYDAYTYQETTSNRMVVAFVRKVDGIAGAMGVDAGQFSNYHGGGQLWRADTFTAPASGGVGTSYTYSGTYVGLLNTGSPTPGGPGGILNPEQAYRVQGRALITADFTEMRVSGGVDQRTVVEIASSLPDISLDITEITTDGTFTDSVLRLESSWTAAGTYGGAFNANGTAVAVVMVFNPTNSPDLFEHGLIVLDDCATAGGPACP